MFQDRHRSSTNVRHINCIADHRLKATLTLAFRDSLDSLHEHLCELFFQRLPVWNFAIASANRHRPQVALASVSNRDGSIFRVARTDDQHVGNHVQLTIADFCTQFFAADNRL